MSMIPIIRNAPVRGTKFRGDDAVALARDLAIDEEVEIAHDEDNEADEYAVAVVARDEHIGFLPRELSAAVLYLAERFDVKAAVTDKTKTGLPIVSVVVCE